MPDAQPTPAFDETILETAEDQFIEQRDDSQRRSSTDRRDGEAKTREYLDSCIFREYETGKQAFIIQSGTVEITRETEDGKVVIGVLEEGAMFGEMALIDDKLRMATARAIGPVTVMVITREMINKKISNADPFVRGLIELLLDHARSTADTLGGLRGFIHTDNFFGPDRRNNEDEAFEGLDRRAG
ncbi:MAG: cyclic nucleotide-binding domain-containing protein [Rhodospirillales bacterium]|jgi:CRP/FNR family transcriptional regulator, cyclic AMP receptor protein|nr:cyclic nucleotide-binding domain-containing protein [Rhodospirillales bacterium]MBT4039199.1 cyclic nucleotide-binding domain-containing protein [Rhodospirillales bacterium]MBT4625612.1 cyclic nucleotide-binding domain-containing protein [Rhodospirillales bacterium]MBT5351475.1 cyclic nucleotide-binding domain-containing protein [Rhodospirillales bacterium]MBT5521442.1 cyclic nucleotide-binding domain-containing protein [Rhodospirillales bacterium]